MSECSYFRSDEDIEEIADGLLRLTLPRTRWTHAAHFGATLWFLTRHETSAVIVTMRRLICKYNEACGGTNTDSSGYHETITVASVRAAAAFLAERATLPLFRVGNELMASRLGKPAWLMEYWTRERLFSVEARRAWVDPDVSEFPY